MRSFRRPEPRARGGAQGQGADRSGSTPSLADCERHAGLIRAGGGAARLPRRAAALVRRAQAGAAREAARPPRRRRSARPGRSRRAGGAAGRAQRAASATRSSRRSRATAAIASSSMGAEIARKRVEKEERRAARGTVRRAARPSWPARGGRRGRRSSPTSARRSRPGESPPDRAGDGAERAAPRRGGRASASCATQHDEICGGAHVAAQAAIEHPGRACSSCAGSCARPCGEVAEDALPFAGELIQVRPEERDWEGATERLLHNFGLSLLVTDAHYAARRRIGSTAPTSASGWSTTASGRARGAERTVRASSTPVRARWCTSWRSSRTRPSTSGSTAGARATLRLRLLRQRSSSSAARQRAITRAGQIKARRRSPREGRPPPHRRSLALRARAGPTRRRSPRWRSRSATSSAGMQAGAVAGRAPPWRARGAAAARRWHLQQLRRVRDFRELDWKPLVDRHRRRSQRERSAAGGGVRRPAHARSSSSPPSACAGEHRRPTEARAQGHDRAERGANAQGEPGPRLGRRLCGHPARRDSAGRRCEYLPALEALRAEARSGQQTLTRRILRQPREGHARVAAGAHRRRETEARPPGARRSSRRWQAYRNDYPLDTQEVDASVEAAGGVSRDARPAPLRRPAALRGALQGAAQREHHPRGRQLPVAAPARAPDHPGADRQSSISRCARSTTTRAATSCSRTRDTTDVEIRDFQQDLRACTEGTLTGSDEETYSEAQVPAGEAHHRALSRPRGHRGARSPLDAQGHRRAQLVRVLRLRALARGRPRARALLRLGRQVGRAEGEARLHGARRQPRVPVRARMGRARGRAPSASSSSTRPSDAARTNRRATGWSCSSSSTCSC